MVDIINRNNIDHFIVGSNEWLKIGYQELQEYVLAIQNEPTKKSLTGMAQQFFRDLIRGEITKSQKTVSFQFLFYANQFGLASVKRDYFEKANFTIGKKELKCMGRNKSLLEAHNLGELQLNLLTFVPLSLIMRDKEAQDFYANLELTYSKCPFYSVASNFLFSKLFYLICSGDIMVLKEHITFLITFEENEYQKRRLDGGRGYSENDFKENNFSIYSSAHSAMLYEGEQIEYLKLPFLKVLKSIFEKDEVNFNKNLLIALEKHKTYYGTFLIEGEEINDRPEGWVSLWLTCACAIAHDKGMKREVTSDYIPEWLVKGEFEGLELVVE